LIQTRKGIGFETALDLAKRGARVVLACRDLDRANKAADEIRKRSGNGNVIVERLDLASLDSVRQFSAKINTTEPRIDLLINNAGIMSCPQWKTKDGFEMQLGTNHLGHFLLTNLLLDKIKATKESRVVNVSSRAYLRGKMNWQDLNMEKGYEPMKAYGQSKLANVLFTRELARRLASDPATTATTNALHPGVVRTELSRYMGEALGRSFMIVYFFIYPLFLWFTKSVEQGAQTTLHCALSEEAGRVSGLYFSDCAVQPLKPHALDDEEAKRLWEISEKMVGL
jgi:NAD(P)-dependent dehydrogenase (short-subunit alcohol dehydrogenase family)